jgi:hypothetical protein
MLAKYPFNTVLHNFETGFETLPGLRGDPVSQLRERIALRVSQIL